MMKLRCEGYSMKGNGIGRSIEASDVRPIDFKSLPGATVTNLDLDVTEGCNLGCHYCFKNEKTARNMSRDEARAAFQWLLAASRRADSVHVNFMGGEPTMKWPLIREFVPWARRRARTAGKAVSFSMTSNLTLWTDEIRDFVDQWGLGVLMSIDGCPEVQDAQRPSKNGKPQSEVIAHWARSMLRTRPRSQARSTLLARYADRFHESMMYIHDLGFRECAVTTAAYEEWDCEAFDVLDRQMDCVIEDIVRMARDRELFGLSVWNYYLSKLVAKRRAGQPIAFQHQPCGAGKGYLMVDQEGDIWPCHRFDGADDDAGLDGGAKLGNIHGPGFNGELQRAFVEFDHEVQHKESCETCPVNEVCAGFCPAANLSATGSLYTPHDNYCRWSQTAYASAERLYDRLAGDPETLSWYLGETATETDGQK